jgi:hypothetical protein
MTATVASTLESPSTNDQASSWEIQQGDINSTDQVAVVYVYDSFKYADKCGHALPLLRLVREVLCATPAPAGSGSGTGSVSSRTSLTASATKATATNTSCCPICQTPIAYVTEVNKKDEPTVVFKYNKQIYRLTVPNTVNARSSSPALASPASTPSIKEPWWKKLLGGGGNDNMNEKRMRAATNTMTAQGRIAQVLGMSVDGGMKVNIVQY